MKRWLFVLAAMIPASTAAAAEFQFEGFYRARMRMFDTLSLQRDIADDEGFTWVIQHRLWIRPKFFITDDVGLFADVLALQNTAWGSNADPWIDPLALQDPLLFRIESLDEDGIADDPDKLPPVQLWRAWGEVNTRIGTFKIGRQPLQWGMGLWRNDGTGDDDDWGDSADRVSWEKVIQDVYVQLGFNVYDYGEITANDETWSLDVAAAYRTERVEGGAIFEYRRGNTDGDVFDLYTVDGAADLQFGPLGVDTEVVLQFGNGDLPGGFNDVRRFGAGFALDASVLIDRFGIHLEGGLATGDKDPTDGVLRSFALDRDYDIGLFLFEQPMPVVVSAVPGEDRDYSLQQMGDGVRNAGWIRPRLAFRALPGFFVDGMVVAAWQFATEEDLVTDERDGAYGVEADLGLRYEALEHFQIGGRAAVFVPGTYFKNYTPDGYPGGFGSVAAGGELWARIRF